MEVCYQCGGKCGEPGENFGDHGWHPCYKCHATGQLPAGTEEMDREAAEYEAGERYWSCEDYGPEDYDCDPANPFRHYDYEPPLDDSLPTTIEELARLYDDEPADYDGLPF